MDTSQVENEEGMNQMQFAQNDFKPTPAVEEFNGAAAYAANSEDVFNIPLPPSDEFGNHQNNANETVDNGENNMDIEPQYIPLPEEEVRHEETVSLMEVPAITETVTEPSIECMDAEGSKSIQEHVTEVQFINEPEESVSLPPTDSLIEERVTSSQDVAVEPQNETVETVTIEEMPSNEVSTEEMQTVADEEMPTEFSTVEVVHTEIVSEEEIPTNPVETEETPEIAETTEIHYTILPPGENSVLQEDGTLIVEYPISTENHSEDKNSSVAENSGTENEKSQEVKQQPPQKQQKPKGRRPTGMIPSHIVGHNIEKPTEVTNGKVPLKPRLGVKIPYRNLTSQMISNTELRQQIVERARQKQNAQVEASQSRIFAKKLTYRLAQSLTGKAKIGKKPDPEPEAETEGATDDPDETNENNGKNAGENIESNSDLIAILEGDGGEETAIVAQVAKSSENDETSSEIKEIEKEISSTSEKTQTRGKKFFKSRETRNSDATKDKIKDAQSRITTSIVSGGNDIEMEETEENEEDVDEPEVIEKEPEPEPVRKVTPKKAKRKGIIDIEPQLKPAMVIKTYTRKRKSNDSPTPADPPKKPAISPEKSDEKTDTSKIDFVPPDVYVTKSSRIIKKKVIWDPDEALPSPRNQAKILNKIEAAAKTTPPTPKASTSKTTPTKPEKDTTTTTTTVEKKTVKSPLEEKEKKTVTPPTNAKNLRSSSPLSQGRSPKKYAKRLTEIDKLLMDEGAVNMLYDVNNSDDQKRRVGGRLAAQNQKEAPGKAQEVESPARKKDTPKKEATAARKMSKDSSKSSVHSPPPSPADFSAAAEASRIIRRHSSSSFSSTNEDVAEEIVETEERQTRRKQQQQQQQPPTLVPFTAEQPSANEEVIRTTRKRNTPQEQPSPRKKAKKEVVAKPDETEAKPEENAVNFEKPVEITVKSAPGNLTMEGLETDPLKPFTVIKMNKHYMINLTYSGGENYLTPQLLNELTVTLKELGKNKNCNVVSLHSQKSAFCLGLDYKSLVDDTDELRKKRANELWNNVREFLKCLLNFPKVLVAGIKSDCIGFAVTILPLFDFVIASDSASFVTPYGKLGCTPEVGFLLSVPFHSNNGLAAELLYTTHRMSADEAHKKGLITKLYWPEKFDSEFLAYLSHVSNLSKMTLVSTKKQLRQVHCQQIESLINTNFKTIIDRWISDECQSNFATYNALTCDIDKDNK